ncbi:unnamed protein product [Sphagnum jensenii]|uniref:Uncharacterized protein n=1 Tax=Sphagnum jensenii TaxID=128206 RepID=A0ABP1ATZ6_9BRYO
MGARVECEREGPDGQVAHQVRDVLQIAADQDTDVLANNQVVHAAKPGRLGMVPGVLDGNHCLFERHVDRDVVHRELEPHGIWDDNLVPVKVVLILDEQFEGVGLLLGLLGGLLGDCAGHVVIIVVVAVGVGQYLVVAEEQVANDRIDNGCRHRCRTPTCRPSRSCADATYWLT